MSAAHLHCWPDELPVRPAYFANHYRSNGTPKATYRTEVEALRAADRLGFTGHNAYRCQTCNRWHIGHVRALR